MPDNDDHLPSDIADLRISAIQLAELAGVRPEDIHYWARKGYITRSGEGSKRPFSMGLFPLTRLMKHLTKQFKMDAGSAAVIARELMKMEPEASDAFLKVLEASQTNLQVLAGVLVEIGFLDAFSKAESEEAAAEKEDSNQMEGDKSVGD